MALTRASDFVFAMAFGAVLFVFLGRWLRFRRAPSIFIAFLPLPAALMAMQAQGVLPEGPYPSLLGALICGGLLASVVRTDEREGPR